MTALCLFCRRPATREVGGRPFCDRGPPFQGGRLMPPSDCARAWCLRDGGHQYPTAEPGGGRRACTRCGEVELLDADVLGGIQPPIHGVVHCPWGDDFDRGADWALSEIDRTGHQIARRRAFARRACALCGQLDVGHTADGRPNANHAAGSRHREAVRRLTGCRRGEERLRERLAWEELARRPVSPALEAEKVGSTWGSEATTSSRS